MSFRALLLQAKGGDLAAKATIYELYQPLLLKESYFYGRFDEDLYQELSLVLLNCIRAFPM